MSYLTVMWVAETGARVELEIEFNESKSSKKPIGSQYANVTEETTLLNSQADKENTIIKSIDISRYEVIDLVSYYLGPMQKNLYQISLLALMYVGLLAYTQVFCAAISAVLANFLSLSSRTILPQVVFGAMVVPLSCMELEEQVAMQAIMALVRFVAIWVMIIGSTVALFTDSTNGNADSAPYLAPDETEGCRMSYTACYSGFGVAFSTALFSQLFQHSVPGLLRQLRGQSEKIKKVPVRHFYTDYTICQRSQKTVP
jgi:amino acid permease